MRGWLGGCTCTTCGWLGGVYYAWVVRGVYYMWEPSTAPGRVEGGGQPVLSFEQCFILFCIFLCFLRSLLGA